MFHYDFTAEDSRMVVLGNLKGDKFCIVFIDNATGTKVNVNNVPADQTQALMLLAIDSECNSLPAQVTANLYVVAEEVLKDVPNGHRSRISL